MSAPERRQPLRPWRWLVIALAVGVIPVVVVKRLDQDNRFCVACHLHEDLFRDMTATPAVTLAGAHFAAKHALHAERCFTCHSGEGVVGWSQVTLLSAWDAARWVVGDRHEPTHMRLPLTDQACLKCHAQDVRGSMTSEETQDFHQLTDHRGLTVACLACHQVHRHGERARGWLHTEVVRPQCARCHREMKAAGGSS